MLEIIRKKLFRGKSLSYSHKEGSETKRSKGTPSNDLSRQILPMPDLLKQDLQNDGISNEALSTKARRNGPNQRQAPDRESFSKENSGVLLMDRTELNNPTSSEESYLWQPKGHPVKVSLHFDFVDKLLVEIMKGFGSIPRRGAEVGGLLLGTSQTKDGELYITVQDFHPVACEHAGGPSYHLSAKDVQEFQAAVGQWRQTADEDSVEGHRMSVVGHYRSHTRDGLGMSDEDIDLMDEHLPGEGHIMMLVKPFATRVSTAGIFFREGGEFLRTDSSYTEFPFRRKELGGGSSGAERLAAAARFGQNRPSDSAIPFSNAPRSPQGARQDRLQQDRQQMPGPDMSGPDTMDPRHSFAGDPPSYSDPAYSEPASQPQAGPEGLYQPERTRKENKIRSGWVWFPLSLIFLALGVLLGFQMALSMRPIGPAALGPEIFNLGLKVIKAGDALNLTWDRQAPAVRSAGRGVLFIKDGDHNLSRPLDVTDLQNGSVVYSRPSPSVTFKLEVYPRDHLLVTESVDYKETP